MKRITFITTLFLLFAAVVFTDTPEEHQDCPALMSVVSNHRHTVGEMMFFYRFMAMNIRGYNPAQSPLKQQTFSKTL